MKATLFGVFVALLVFVAGCTWGLGPEEAAAVTEFQAKLVSKKAEYKQLQETIAKLAEDISQCKDGAILKELWAKRDELIVTAAKVKGEIDQVAAEINALKAKGVPAWSIALNVLEGIIVALFGAGGLAAALISRIKSAAVRKTLAAVVDGVEASSKSGGTVKTAIKTAATAAGVEPLLNEVVKART